MCSISVAPAIQTERLRLRTPRPADAPRITRFADDIDVARMTTRMPHPYQLSDAEGFLAQLHNPLSKDMAVFAIDAECEGLIGMIGFHWNEDDKPEMGYWLGKPFWGKGFATEAARAALKWAKTGWGRNVIYAGHFADNAASGAVLVKSGFLYTGDIKRLHSNARGEDVDTRMMVWLA
jgi:RimJ/RimL family protein N-acetyltransferase